MHEIYESKLPNKTAVYLYKVSFICFLFGIPNIWVEDFPTPKVFNKAYAIYIFILLEWGAFVMQNELTDKQETDRIIYSISHPILAAYGIMISRNQEEVKDLIGRLLELKAVHNEPEVEARMVRKARFYSVALVMILVASMALYSIGACLQVFLYNGTYTTVITAWPPVNERSAAASAMRTLSNIMWWMLRNRTYGCFTLVINLTSAICYQFVNLQAYFCNLDTIFRQSNLSQREKERKYEEGLKIGIKMHLDTCKCFDDTVKVCGGVFNGQIVFVITMLVFLMIQLMKPGRTMVNAFATVLTGSAVLLGTGFFFWNAGDITIEASDLATAIYSSGWQNCHGNSQRLRNMVVIAMTHAQKPLVIQGLGIMELSYQSFINIVKTSYSVFSVLY